MGHQWHSGVADAINETHLQSIREKLVEHPEAAAVAAQAERLGRQAIQPAEASEEQKPGERPEELRVGKVPAPTGEPAIVQYSASPQCLAVSHAAAAWCAASHRIGGCAAFALLPTSGSPRRARNSSW